jgi:hypothetical protein
MRIPVYDDELKTAAEGSRVVSLFRHAALEGVPEIPLGDTIDGREPEGAGFAASTAAQIELSLPPVCSLRPAGPGRRSWRDGWSGECSSMAERRCWPRWIPATAAWPGGSTTCSNRPAGTVPMPRAGWCRTFSIHSGARIAGLAADIWLVR